MADVSISSAVTATPIPANLATYCSGVRVGLLVARRKRIGRRRSKPKNSTRPGTGVSPRHNTPSMSITSARSARSWSGERYAWVILKSLSIVT